MRRVAGPAVVALALVLSAGATSGPRAIETRSDHAPIFGFDEREGGLERDDAAATAVALAPAAPTRRAGTCGKGWDVMVVRRAQQVAASCEVVTRQLSRDPYRNRGAQHETEVEPSSFSHGSTMVTVFQAGRFGAGGGAANIGFATSRDAGRTWESGFLPGLSLFSSPTGGYARVGDPVVTYDARHGVWLASALAQVGAGLDLVVSGSRDGVEWRLPAVARRSTGDGVDKEWIACDNWRRSPYYGRCYLSYVDFDSNDIQTQHSRDGGRTWSAPTRWPVATRTIVNGVQPLVRRDGTLLVAFTLFDRFGNADALATVRSTDGGATLGDFHRVAEMSALDIVSVRSAPLPSGAVDAAGTIWLTWSDCAFIHDCGANGVVVMRSRDGRSWTTPTPVRVGEPAQHVDHFVPAIAVSGSGARTRVAIVYYTARQPIGCGYTCLGEIDAWLSLSRDAARTWREPVRLNVNSMRFRWIAASFTGRMLGDYIAVSFVRGRAIPIFSLAFRPAGGFRQAIFATTRISR